MENTANFEPHSRTLYERKLNPRCGQNRLHIVQRDQIRFVREFSCFWIDSLISLFLDESVGQPHPINDSEARFKSFLESPYLLHCQKSHFMCHKSHVSLLSTVMYHFYHIADNSMELQRMMIATIGTVRILLGVTKSSMFEGVIRSLMHGLVHASGGPLNACM